MINSKFKIKYLFKRSTLRVPRPTSKGFTIVETLVAVTIFSFALTAIISVSAQGITNATRVKNRLTANYLAQEYIDYVRALRLSAVTQSGANWNTDFLDQITAPNVCGVVCCCSCSLCWGAWGIS